MKYKQTNSSSSDAWRKIGIAAVLIVAAFGLLLFLEGRMTGMAPANSGFTKVSSVALKENIPQIKTIDIITGVTGYGKDTVKLILVGGNISGNTPGNVSFVLNLKLEKSLKNVSVSTMDYGSVPVVIKKGAFEKTMLLGKNNEIIKIKYLNWKYDSKKKAYYPNMEFNWVKEKALDLSDGQLKKELALVDGENKFSYNGMEYTNLAIGGKTYSFKMLFDPTGGVTVYFNKLSDFVGYTNSTTFSVKDNGKLKVTVWGTDENMNLVADVQWIKPSSSPTGMAVEKSPGMKGGQDVAGSGSDKAPVFETTKLANGKTGVVYEATIKVKDPENDPLGSVSITKGKQTGMTVDEAQKGTGSIKLKWDKPTAEGKYSLTLKACSANKYGVEKCTSKKFILIVSSGDTAPSFATKSLPDATEAVKYKQEIKATDAEGDKVLLSFENKDNQYVTLTKEQEKWYLGWTSPGPAGQYNFLVKACSTGTTGIEKCKSKEFSLTVKADKGPEFITESLPGGVLNQAYEATVQVKEPEGNEVTLTSKDTAFKVTSPTKASGIADFKISSTKFPNTKSLTLEACSTGASGKKQCATKSYALSVDVDHPPQINFNIENGAGEVTVQDKDEDEVELKAVVLNWAMAGLEEGTGLNYNIAGAAKGGMKIVLTGEPAAGIYSIKVQACSIGVSGEEKCDTKETVFTVSG